jgi:hypothetical protein
MDVRQNSTYLMLKHLLPYKEIFFTFIGANYGLVNVDAKSAHHAKHTTSRTKLA